MFEYLVLLEVGGVPGSFIIEEDFFNETSILVKFLKQNISRRLEALLFM